MPIQEHPTSLKLRGTGKIIPHLWFDKEAKEAAEFYTSLFPNSEVTNVMTLEGTPGSDTDVVSFQLLGFSFMAMSAGPLFKFNPSVSFMINFDPSQNRPPAGGAKTRIDDVWEKLAEGGKVLMPLDTYPFSERYGWVQDKYGLSWQLILTNPEGEERPLIIPLLLFVSEGGEEAEAATDFYLSVFSARGGSASGGQDSQRGVITRYGKGQEPNKEGAVMFTDFQLAGQWFAAMDGSAKQHHFAFNEAVSLMVHCDTQEEIDYFWEKLSAHPESEQCGWLKDKYGVSWQITPTAMDEMMKTSDKEALKRVTEAFLKMKKFDLAELQRAYEGK